MATPTGTGRMSLVRRYRRRLLDNRVLAAPLPPTKRFVIVKAVGKGKPTGYFRYHPQKVWCWTASPKTAAVFRTEEAAQAAIKSTNCWHDHYQIRQLG